MSMGLLLGAAGWAIGASAQTPRSPASAAVTASAPNIGKVAATAPSKPLWSELTALQQSALKPLEMHWNGLSEPHKRRWLALSRNYARLSAEEQRTLHGRMTEWAALSGRERIQARLNFAEVKQLAPNERKAKWEAYQALSEEDKRLLADQASVRPKSAAVPIRLVPAQKLVQVPPPPQKGEHGPRIQLAPPANVQRASRRALPEPSPETQVSNPVLATPSLSVAPIPALAPVVPMVRMTEQPSSAP